MSTLLEKASLVMIPSGYKEDIVYSQIPTNGDGDLTFTRASDATRVNSAGLVEVTPWNYKNYSEDLTNGVGLQSSTISTITANTTETLDPFGTNKADKFDGNSGQLADTYNPIPENSVITSSIYAKAGSVSTFILRMSAAFGTNAQATFNLSSGTITATSGDVYLNSTITPVGNGWYRCSITYNFNSIPTNRILLNANGSLYFFGWQLNIGSTAKPYFPTTDRLNVPRLTYQNGGGGCPSLLLEKQSTNLVTYSEQFDNAVYTKSNTSVTANSAISPDGTQNADTVANTGTNNTPELFQLYSSASSSTAYTLSCYMKANTHTKGVLRAYNGGSTTTPLVLFDLSAGTVIASYGDATNPTITNVGNGWYRCSMTFTTISATVGIYVHITNLSNTYTYQSSFNYVDNYNNTGSIYIWGAQLEASSYATSYIPTTSSAATRVADAVYKTGISSLIGQTEGTIFVDVSGPSKTGDARYIGVSNGTDTNRILFYSSNLSTISLYWQSPSGSGQLNFTAINGRMKMAAGYKNNDIVVYCNGVLQTSTTSAPISMTLNTVFVGTYENATIPNSLDQSINEALVFKTRLTNAELAALTTL